MELGGVDLADMEAPEAGREQNTARKNALAARGDYSTDVLKWEGECEGTEEAEVPEEPNVPEAPVAPEEPEAAEEPEETEEPEGELRQGEGLARLRGRWRGS